MNYEKWMELLNSKTEEELEEMFVGMSVRIVTYHGRIVGVYSNAL